jgi:Methyltransferase domain
MFDKTIRLLLQNPSRIKAVFSTDPVEVWLKLQDRYAEGREQKNPVFRYDPEPAWEERLHRVAKMVLPPDAILDFSTLWDELMGSLRAKGIAAGPCGFGTWNDGDAGFSRAIWSLVLHLQPSRVVETGVAHGVTSRVILEGMKRNHEGHLWSVDMPPLDPSLRAEVGLAVTPELRQQWTYVRGSSRRRLPSLLKKLGSIDLFIHDSLHTGRNVLFELECAWPYLRTGGAIVVDDIDVNDGFHRFTQRFPDYPSFICEAEPVRDDLRRFNKRGLFGVILNMPGLLSA